MYFFAVLLLQCLQCSLILNKHTVPQELDLSNLWILPFYFQERSIQFSYYGFSILFAACRGTCPTNIICTINIAHQPHFDPLCCSACTLVHPHFYFVCLIPNSAA